MAMHGWRKEYATGIGSMDQQHQQLFILLAGLYDSIKGGRENAANQVEPILIALLDYARKHFHDEEDLMRRHFYPGLQEHVELHGDLVRSLALHIDEFRHDKLTPLQLAIFIRDWIIHHLIEEDHKYGDFIRSRSA